ncbi:hypothetical protein HDU99_003576, partial [Rhizoclosmatium hyalinum]
MPQLDGQETNKLDDSGDRGAATRKNINQNAAELDSVVLYVGNIPFASHWSQVRDLFTQSGKVLRVDSASDGRGNPKGFATVTMGSNAEAKTAIEMFHGSDFGGRCLYVRMNREQQKEKTNQIPALGFDISVSSHAEISSSDVVQVDTTSQFKGVSIATQTFDFEKIHQCFQRDVDEEVMQDLITELATAKLLQQQALNASQKFKEEKEDMDGFLNGLLLRLENVGLLLSSPNPACVVSQPPSKIPALYRPVAVRPQLFTIVYVGNLNLSVTLSDLKELFRNVGNVIRVSIETDDKDASKVNGAVTLSTWNEAKKAVDMYHGFEWKGRRIEVQRNVAEGSD